MNKIKRIMVASAVVEGSKTFSLEDVKDKKSLAIGGSEPGNNAKRFKCHKCNSPVYLTGDCKKIVEQKKAKPTCIGCAYKVMKKSKKFETSMFERDKEYTRKKLEEALDEEIDKAIPFEAG